MHLTEAQINDFVDEALSAEESEIVTQHLAQCADCRNEAEALRAVVQRVALLPKEISPARDLRPDTRARTQGKTLWAWRYQLAAAAVFLIIASSTMTMFMMRPRNDGLVVRAEKSAGPVIDLVSLERQYGGEVQELQRVLQQNRSTLSPETVKILEENLQIIDRAIHEARSALGTDPSSAMLGELLRSAYQRKLDLLKQAARSTAST